MKLKPLHRSIGVEVTEVELTATGIGDGTTADDIDRLRSALDTHHLVLFPKAALEGAAQVALTARFGPLLPERGLWGYVSNVRPDGVVREGRLLFHSDFAFSREAVLAISLQAVEVPADGTSTLFADAAAAARTLDPTLRERLAGRRVLNCYDLLGNGDHRMLVTDIDPRSPRHEHPIIGTNPRTGEEVVMANEMHTDSIVGLRRSESEALLQDVFAVLYDEANVYEHQWDVGDLLLWDNTALHHARDDLAPNDPRTLQRVALGRYTPSELVPDLAEQLASRR